MALFGEFGRGWDMERTLVGVGMMRGIVRRNLRMVLLVGICLVLLAGCYSGGFYPR